MEVHAVDHDDDRRHIRALFGDSAGRRRERAPIQSRDVPGTILGTNIPDEFVKLRYANRGAYAQGPGRESP